jgi:hypothetical protein
MYIHFNQYGCDGWNYRSDGLHLPQFPLRHIRHFLNEPFQHLHPHLSCRVGGALGGKFVAKLLQSRDLFRPFHGD